MSNIDELERLAKLKESGALTEQEFESKKAALLGSSSTAKADVSLWNPEAAAKWSVLLSPVFGAFLQAKNWTSLGQKDKARKSMIWVYAGIVILLIAMFQQGTIGSSIVVVFLLIWYFSSAKGQAKYVKAELNDKYERKGWLKPIIIAVISLGILIVFSTAINQQGISDSKNVKVVKGGVLQMCPNATVEQMVNGFMGSPSWKSGESKSGIKYVNVGGDITYHEKKVRAVIQFTIDEKNNSFKFNAFEINDVPQANLIASALLKKMCESTGN
jgi:hypothetical protein